MGRYRMESSSDSDSDAGNQHKRGRKPARGGARNKGNRMRQSRNRVAKPQAKKNCPKSGPVDKSKLTQDLMKIEKTLEEARIKELNLEKLKNIQREKMDFITQQQRQILQQLEMNKNVEKGSLQMQSMQRNTRVPSHLTNLLHIATRRLELKRNEEALQEKQNTWAPGESVEYSLEDAVLKSTLEVRRNNLFNLIEKTEKNLATHSKRQLLEEPVHETENKINDAAATVDGFECTQKNDEVNVESCNQKGGEENNEELK